ncbi:MAG: hypothetical protein AAFV93_14955 [Chloroflexota bacterium]
MRIENLVQWIVIAVMWAAIMLVLVILAIISMLTTAWTMPMWWILVLFVLGVGGTAFVLTTDRFQELNQKITEELDGLSEEELDEIREGLAELRENMGITVELPIKAKHKPKRDIVDQAIRNLSDDELVQLRDQLRSGDIDPSRLEDLLNVDR